MVYNNTKVIAVETMEIPEAAAVSKEEIFTRLVKAHIDEIYNFAYHMVFDYDEAEDIAQKTFISLHQNLSKLDFSASLRPWLFKVARNHALDFLKKKKAVVFSQMEEGEQTFDVPAEDPDLESHLDDSMFLEKVRSLVSQLPVPLKEIILLKYFEDLTFEEIAAAIDLPVNTVKSHFYRGKYKLYGLIKSLTSPPTPLHELERGVQ